MAIITTCNKCGQSFAPSISQQQLIQQVLHNGGKIAMLNCPLCKKMFTHELCRQTVNDALEIPFFCPVTHCGGWVSFVNDLEDSPPFYGCGECGRVWADRAELESDITVSITTWPYRNAAYITSATGGWSPVNYPDIPQEVIRLVELEPSLSSNTKKSKKSEKIKK